MEGQADAAGELAIMPMNSAVLVLRAIMGFNLFIGHKDTLPLRGLQMGFTVAEEEDRREDLTRIEVGEDLATFLH
jgi:hypothetical protein